jgi:osmotically-inducible protein OsmY
MVLLMLQGCANVAMSSAQAVYNHHSLQKNFKDQMITMRAYKALNVDNTIFKEANISVAAFHGEVLLVGQAPQHWLKMKAEKTVREIPDVTRIYNVVTIANPSSSLTRMSDAWITAKVKSKIIASDDVDGTQVKVVTENGTVYLMGMLLPSQANAAVVLASSTTGVEKVVKIFTYLRISKI